MNVPNRLGLTQAIHRKTSIQRLCLIRFKEDLPVGTSRKELRNLVKILQKCDHCNVLTLQEALEDNDHLYFMYEHLPCYTLQSMLESHTWTQEDLVNIIRECGAAMWFAEQLGLLHLGWTLCHILIPVANMHRPMMCKVFGFGLMGVLVTDSHERLCWSPECLEKYQAMNGNPNWMTKVERSLLPMCDSWSLGTTVFALVSRRSPALTEAQAVSKKWQFTLAIDDVDPEAKSLIEGLLDPMADRRMSSEKAMRHEWIRRRWRPPPGVRKAFLKLEDFCVSPLPKRLFGRFLVRFLDSGHLLKIAKTFYSLDIGGTGCLNLKGLQIASRSAGRPTNAAENIWDHLGADGTAISLVRFAECLAEEVIDGRALRHAFESLDDNGSEQVSAPELFDALAALDDSLTMEEVVKHIERAELDIESDEEDEHMQDHAIDYNEFVQLFPVRMARMGALKDRMLTSKSQWEDLTRSFESVSPEVDKWLRHIDTTLLTIRDLASKAVDNRNEYAGDAARGLKLQFAKIDEGLKCPPGPITQPEMQAKIKLGKKGLAQFYGFDTFMQDQALVENWHNLVSAEIKNLKAALAVNSKISGGVDSSKAGSGAPCCEMFKHLQRKPSHQAFSPALSAAGCRQQLWLFNPRLEASSCWSTAPPAAFRGSALANVATGVLPPSAVADASAPSSVNLVGLTAVGATLAAAASTSRRGQKVAEKSGRAAVVARRAETMAATAIANGNFTILVKALQKACLVATVSGKSPYTVFAPIDAAFADLLKELGCSAEQLLANPDLKSILLYHVVGGSTMSSSLKDGQKVTTAQSGQLAVQIAGGKVKVGRATVTAADIECSDGVIHVIDKVLRPPFSLLMCFHPVLLLGDAVQGGLRRRLLLLFFGSYIQNDGACYSSSTTALTMTPARALSKVMGSSDAFILLLQLFMAVTSTGSAEIIAVSIHPSPYTVFAPIDAAFADLLKELGCSAEQLLANPDLKSILLYHVVGGSTMSSSLKDGQKVTTAQSGQLAVQIAGGKVKVGRATVTAADIECSNGVIHVIDKQGFHPVLLLGDAVQGGLRHRRLLLFFGSYIQNDGACYSSSTTALTMTPARALSKVMGSSGAFILLLQLFMAVTSTGSAEIIAVSSSLTYDIYYTCLNPELKGRRDGLRLIFQQASPYTVFAPIDAAFADLLKELGCSAEQLLANPDLKSILLYRVVGGSTMSSSLKDGQKVTTAQSGQLAVQIAGGKVKVGRATVTAAEIECFTFYASPGDSIGLYGSPSKASIQSFFSATQSKEDFGAGGYFSSLGSYIQNDGACYSSSTWQGSCHDYAPRARASLHLCSCLWCWPNASQVPVKGHGFLRRFHLAAAAFHDRRSTGSAEIIAVSSILTYDIYYTYVNPELKGRRGGLLQGGPRHRRYFSSLGSYIQNNGACYSSSTTALEKSCSFKKLAKDEWCCSSDVAVTGDGHHCRASTKDFIDVSETQHFESSECDFAAGERCVTSFLTMGSPSGLLFGITNIVGNFGTVFVDPSYWQSAVAANPKSAVKGFLIGGLVGFAAPFCMATTTGLAGRALTMHPELWPAHISAAASGAGLTPARVLSKVMGSSGAFILLLQLVMAVTSTGSAEIIAGSCILAYDIYYTYVNPDSRAVRTASVSSFSRLSCLCSG
ncbi:unnamed protein product [Polarella glacialis]|uniref:Calmodulin n=1 Tax=Polarella glacialis TaxID=89957 RepID=A0A813JAY6_POLGL|nr:unnamed protein product [Polarella glacialis]